MKISLPRSQKGFTLVELLVVIAVLGVLAAGVLVAINPLEQLARGRDTGRKSAITEMGRGLVAYFTAQNSYPAGSTWMTQLVTTGEVKVQPTNPNYQILTPITCANTTGGYCYATNTGFSEAVVYAQLESGSERTRAACATGQLAWFVYATALGRSGYFCTGSGAQPTVATVTSLN